MFSLACVVLSCTETRFEPGKPPFAGRPYATLRDIVLLPWNMILGLTYLIVPHTGGLESIQKREHAKM